VASMSIREALTKREGMEAIPALCDSCNMRQRYGAGELTKTALRYAGTRIRSSFASRYAS
jgi:hypothetical protein